MSDLSKLTPNAETVAALREAEWMRLNAVFHKALDTYPGSWHALHYLWNEAIATDPKQKRELPRPLVFED